MKEQQGYLQLWKNKNYLLLWSGQVISTVGSQISLVAFPLLILALTGSAWEAGLAGAIRAFPYLVLSLPAGVLIDRWDRKQIMIWCDVGRTISLASIPVALAFGHLSVLQIYLVSFIEGTLYVFFNLTEAACLRTIVPREQLPEASAQNQTADATAALVGPFLGGLLYSLLQLLPFLADAFSYACSVVSLFFIKGNFQLQRTEKQSWRVEAMEGLTWLWQHPLVRFLAIFSGLSNLLSASYPLLIVILANRVHALPVVIGLIFTFGGLGSVFGAFIAPFVQRRWNFGQSMPLAWWLWAGLTLLYVLAPNPFALGLISLLLFMLWPICNTVQYTYRLALIPDALQGRVNSAFRLIAFSGQPLGLALTGWLIEQVGIVPAVIFTGIGLALIALMGILNPHVRHAQPFEDITEETKPTQVSAQAQS